MDNTSPADSGGNADTNPGDMSRRDRLLQLAPALRGLLAEGARLGHCVFEDTPQALAFASSKAVGEALRRALEDDAPETPWLPLWLEVNSAAQPGAPDGLRARVDAYKARRSTLPAVIVAEGLGVFCVAPTEGAARAIRLALLEGLEAGCGAAGGVATAESVEQVCAALGELADSPRRLADEYPNRPGRVSGKVALVTGAAQGFGLGIAREMAREGASVVLADINLKGAREAADTLNAQYGPGSAQALEANVTDSGSVHLAAATVARFHGGLDVLVSNAGVLRAESVKTQSEDDFDFVTRVNYRGYFVCVKYLSPLFAAQHAFNPEWRGDIIQINSKSGLEGSNKNFAYAGGKFGGIGLTQSFALELIEDGVKVNSICPGNFFDGPLWSDPKNGLFVQYLEAGKVPGAETIDDVRRAYEAKVPMGRGCRVEDVMHAMYYVIDQQYETGQAVPVTGGQVMLR